MTAGRSVNSETSPVNSRGPWTTIVFGSSARFVHDRDLARLDDVEGQPALPGLEDRLAVLERADLRQSGQAFDLGLAELREREVMHVIDVRHGLVLSQESVRPPNRSGVGKSAILFQSGTDRNPFYGAINVSSCRFSSNVGRIDNASYGPLRNRVRRALTARTSRRSQT